MTATAQPLFFALLQLVDFGTGTRNPGTSTPALQFAAATVSVFAYYKQLSKSALTFLLAVVLVFPRAAVRDLYPACPMGKLEWRCRVHCSTEGYLTYHSPSSLKLNQTKKMNDNLRLAV